MRELIHQVQAKYPHDKFFVGVGESLRVSPLARTYYRAYDRALSCLDSDSWLELTRKALAHFRDHRSGQLKQGFFNQLNDAFAYQHLVRRGYSKVRVLRESDRRTPDISYADGTTPCYCEVKSIGISEKEIVRRKTGPYIRGETYSVLSEEFFRKLNSDLSWAQEQINSRGTRGLVFLIANFDDFTLTHYDRYRVQLSEFLYGHPVPEIYVKVGIVGGRRVHKAGT